MNRNSARKLALLAGCACAAMLTFGVIWSAATAQSSGCESIYGCGNSLVVNEYSCEDNGKCCPKDTNSLVNGGACQFNCVNRYLYDDGERLEYRRKILKRLECKDDENRGGWWPI